MFAENMWQDYFLHWLVFYKLPSFTKQDVAIERASSTEEGAVVAGKVFENIASVDAQNADDGDWVLQKLSI